MQIVELALAATRETKRIEFKQFFDPNSPGEWCEILKDIVAMANSGGGIILFGVDNKGAPNGFDVRPILAVDSAAVADKIHSYTEVHFSDFEIRPLTKGSCIIAAIRIGASKVPIVFVRPGTYAVSPTKQATAFGRGTLYFRHGAKSDTGVSDDLRQFVDRRLREIRREWLDGVAKVVRAPEGSSVTVLQPGGETPSAGSALPVRLVEDQLAPAGRLIDTNATHPYRQIDVVTRLREAVPSLGNINSFDILAVRRVFHIDGQLRFYYKPKFASPQYSETFLEFLIRQYAGDPDFFTKARDQYRSPATQDHSGSH